MANRFDPSQAVDGTPPLGVAACRWAYGGEATSDSEGGIMVGLSAWVRGEQPRTEGRSPWDALFWGIVDKLARADAAKGDDARRIVLDYLNDGSLSLRDQERKRVQNLRDSLESLLGLPEATQGELFQRYTTPLPRALLLLFLRETCAELAAFESPVLKEEDWLAAAVLFGAKDGLLGVPLELRGGCASSAAITHRMAALSQRMAGSGMELGAAPRRRNPLAEYFIGTWGAREREAALDLARRQKFDCIETRVALPNGAYALDVNRGGMELVLRGEAKAVTTAANREQFLGCLRQAVVEPKHEQAVIDLLDPEPNDRA